MFSIRKSCLLIFLIFLFQPPIARAQTYNVEILQNYPEQASAKGTCTAESNICFLTLLQNPDAETPQYVDVSIKIETGNVYFQFIQNRNHLSTEQTWKPDVSFPFDKNNRATGNVALYIPHEDEEQGSLLIQPAIRLSNKKVAELEIFVSPE